MPKVSAYWPVYDIREKALTAKIQCDINNSPIQWKEWKIVDAGAFSEKLNKIKINK